jgi:outer membrane immunogenic protein
MSTPFTDTRPRAHPLVLAASLFAATMPLACGSFVAAAADLPTKVASTPAPAVYNWTGCYVGGNAGGGAASSNFRATVGPGGQLVPADAGEVSFDGSGSADTSNFLGGGQAGCNWQSGTLVYGFEGDADYLHSKSQFYNDTNTLPVAGATFVAGQTLKTEFFATVRPRVGIAADRNFAYVTGGAAFTRASYTESYTDGAGGNGVATGSKFLAGWTAGAGWEYALTDHWLLRFEYLFAGFPKTSANGLIAGPGGSNPLSGSADLVIQVARAGINFKF